MLLDKPIESRPRNVLQKPMKNDILLPHGVDPSSVQLIRNLLNSSRINAVHPFKHNPCRTAVGTARARACAQVAGRHMLAIQDTSALRVNEKGLGLSFHPVIAVDANGGTVLGLVDNFFLMRHGGERGNHKQRAFEAKDSRRWLSGAESASVLAEAGAACVTVIEDREGDIYECFAFKPANVEKLVRAAQDRRLADGTSLFAKADAWDEAGRMTVELPAARAAPRATPSCR